MLCEKCRFMARYGDEVCCLYFGVKCKVYNNPEFCDLFKWDVDDEPR